MSTPVTQRVVLNMNSDDREAELLKIDWYHPTADRHTAESLLLQNGSDGTYLLRPSSKKGSFDLSFSIRCRDAVKHFSIVWTGYSYKFGMTDFFTLHKLNEHFENHPLIGGDSGVLTACKEGYPRYIAEPNIYDRIQVHAELGRTASVGCRRHNLTTDLAIASKEGFLTKQGGNVKNWKRRWFVLNRNSLKYYRDRCDKQHVRELDLQECSECSEMTGLQKENCFKLVFPWRTFYIHGATKDETDSWMELINWKLAQLESRK